MRINLYLTPSKPLPKLLSSSAASVPKPLLALSPDGELVLIELQGSLEMELAAMGEGGIGRQIIGELMWGDGKEVSPLQLDERRMAITAGQEAHSDLFLIPPFASLVPVTRRTSRPSTCLIIDSKAS